MAETEGYRGTGHRMQPIATAGAGSDAPVVCGLSPVAPVFDELHLAIRAGYSRSERALAAGIRQWMVQPWAYLLAELPGAKGTTA